MPGSEKITWMPCSRQAAEPAAGAPQQDQRDADDDRRDGERQVDDRLHDPAPAEAAARERERRDDAEDDVQRHDDRDDLQRQRDRRDARPAS